MHQFLQFKEKQSITPLGNVTNFLSHFHYLKSAIKEKDARIYGVTGTLGNKKIVAFLQNSFDVCCVRLPSHKQKQLIRYSPQLLNNDNDWLAAIIERVEIEHHSGRPTLIISSSIASSEQLLSALGKYYPQFYLKEYVHSDDDNIQQVLQAKLAPGSIVIATCLAGRGVDIKLLPEVLINGGLHVILTDLSGEITRLQNEGRTARGGQPGSVEFIIDKSKQLPGFNDIDIDFDVLLAWVDKLNRKKFKNFCQYQLPIINLKDDLFDRFCQFLQDLESTFRKRFYSSFTFDAYSKATGHICKIAAIKERWGFWLQKILMQIEKAEAFDAVKANIEKQFKDFCKELEKEFHDGLTVIQNPTYLVNYANNLIGFLNSWRHTLTGLSRMRERAFFCKLYEQAIKLDGVFIPGSYVNLMYPLLSPGFNTNNMFFDTINAAQEYFLQHKEAIISERLVAKSKLTKAEDAILGVIIKQLVSYYNLVSALEFDKRSPLLQQINRQIELMQQQVIYIKKLKDKIDASNKSVELYDRRGLVAENVPLIFAAEALKECQKNGISISCSHLKLKKDLMKNSRADPYDIIFSAPEGIAIEVAFKHITIEAVTTLLKTIHPEKYIALVNKDNANKSGLFKKLQGVAVGVKNTAKSKINTTSRNLQDYLKDINPEKLPATIEFQQLNSKLLRLLVETFDELLGLKEITHHSDKDEDLSSYESLYIITIQWSMLDFVDFSHKLKNKKINSVNELTHDNHVDFTIINRELSFAGFLKEVKEQLAAAESLFVEENFTDDIFQHLQQLTPVRLTLQNILQKDLLALLNRILINDNKILSDLTADLIFGPLNKKESGYLIYLTEYYLPYVSILSKGFTQQKAKIFLETLRKCRSYESLKKINVSPLSISHTGSDKELSFLHSQGLYWQFDIIERNPMKWRSMLFVLGVSVIEIGLATATMYIFPVSSAFFSFGIAVLFEALIMNGYQIIKIGCSRDFNLQYFVVQTGVSLALSFCTSFVSIGAAGVNEVMKVSLGQLGNEVVEKSLKEVFWTSVQLAAMGGGEISKNVLSLALKETSIQLLRRCLTKLVPKAITTGIDVSFKVIWETNQAEIEKKIGNCFGDVIETKQTKIKRILQVDQLLGNNQNEDFLTQEFTTLIKNISIDLSSLQAAVANADLSQLFTAQFRRNMDNVIERANAKLSLESILLKNIQVKDIEQPNEWVEKIQLWCEWLNSAGIINKNFSCGHHDTFIEEMNEQLSLDLYKDYQWLGEKTQAIYNSLSAETDNTEYKRLRSSLLRHFNLKVKKLSRYMLGAVEFIAKQSANLLLINWSDKKLKSMSIIKKPKLDLSPIFAHDLNPDREIDYADLLQKKLEKLSKKGLQQIPKQLNDKAVEPVLNKVTSPLASHDSSNVIEKKQARDSNLAGSVSGINIEAQKLALMIKPGNSTANIVAKLTHDSDIFQCILGYLNINTDTLMDSKAFLMNEITKIRKMQKFQSDMACSHFETLMHNVLVIDKCINNEEKWLEGFFKKHKPHLRLEHLKLLSYICRIKFDFYALEFGCLDMYNSITLSPEPSQVTIPVMRCHLIDGEQKPKITYIITPCMSKTHQQQNQVNLIVSPREDGQSNIPIKLGLYNKGVEKKDTDKIELMASSSKETKRH